MFDLGPYYRSADGLFTRQWDIDAAGGKFLVLKPGDAAVATDAATRPQLVVVRNWFEELKRLSPSR